MAFFTTKRKNMFIVMLIGSLLQMHKLCCETLNLSEVELFKSNLNSSFPSFPRLLK
jgi:hypothetical protein